MLIHWKERHRRMREREEEAWRKADREADAELRHRYDAMPRAPIRLLTCPLSKEVNHGGILRVAEAFRIESIRFSPEEDRAIDGSGHRGTKRWQPYRWQPLEESLEEAVGEGYHPVALTLGRDAVDVASFRWPFRLALVVGSELEGIPDSIVDRCEATVAVPLYGIVESLNVVVAAALCLQEAVRAYREVDPSFLPARQASRRLILGADVRGPGPEIP